MSVYLSLGKDENGDFQSISSQKSGKTKLGCPFCDVLLIAAKGKIKAHHFRHDGETCKEALNEEMLQLPAWHQFHLSFSFSVIDELKRNYRPEEDPDYFFSSNIFIPWKDRTQLLYDDGYHSWKYRFTDTAKVILGAFSLAEFSSWMRDMLKVRILDLKEGIKRGDKHKAWLDIEAYRQEQILNATLYFFQYKLEDKTFVYKVGRTRRKPNLRLEETIRDIEEQLGKKVIKAKILARAKNQGHVEKYVFHRYEEHKAYIRNLTEYLYLEDEDVEKIKAEFKELNDKIEPFDKAERFITSGRWKYEERRLEASRRAIENRTGNFGRPKGTALSDDDFLSKHKDIVKAVLELGCSISQATEHTGKGRSTVKRVKNRLTELGFKPSEKTKKPHISIEPEDPK